MVGPVLAALIASQPAANPLVGIWRSDEARTHEEIRRHGSKLGAKKKELLFSPGFFGRMVYVFDERRVMMVFDGECQRPVGYRYQMLEEGRVQVLLLMPDPNQDTILEAELVDEEYRVRMGSLGGIKEIFRRVSIDAVRDYACIEERLASKGPLDSDAAAELAAQLANDECERVYQFRPFSPEDWPIAKQKHRWSWGDVDPSGPHGYSAAVTFEEDGSLPVVRIFLITDVDDL